VKDSESSFQAQLNVGSAATALKNANCSKFNVLFAANVIPLELFGARQELIVAKLKSYKAVWGVQKTFLRIIPKRDHTKEGPAGAIL